MRCIKARGAPEPLGRSPLGTGAHAPALRFPWEAAPTNDHGFPSVTIKAGQHRHDSKSNREGKRTHPTKKRHLGRGASAVNKTRCGKFRQPAYSFGLVFGSPMTFCPSLYCPRERSNSTRSKRFRTLRFATMVLAPLRERCWDIRKYSGWRKGGDYMHEKVRAKRKVYLPRSPVCVGIECRRTSRPYAGYRRGRNGYRRIMEACRGSGGPLR
jgi:hypothetical protein